MRFSPEQVLINNNDVVFKKILVSGSDESLISLVSKHILKKFKDENFFIDTSGDPNTSLIGDLFSEKKILFLLNDGSTKKEALDEINQRGHSYLISSTNNKKTNNLKKEFSKNEAALLIDCYPLNRLGKEFVLKSFIQLNNIKISNDVFWYVLESFDNSYVIFSKQLELLSLYNKKIELITDVEKIVYVDNKIEINKFFFQILKSNQSLIRQYNKNILSSTDFNIFLNSLKTYVGIIGQATNKEEAILKFPKYLFNEKSAFLKIYDCLNSEKLKKIYTNIFRAENLIRKNPDLFSSVGMRFTLNLKKTIIS